MSTLLLNHVAVNDINPSPCVSSFSAPSSAACLSDGLAECVGAVGVGKDPVGGLAVGGTATWPRTDHHSEVDPCVMSYDASSAAVVAAARFMHGYRHQPQQQQPPATLPLSSSSAPTSSGE